MRRAGAPVAPCRNLRLRGLMCMPPAETESRASANGFARRARSSTICNEHGFGLDTLSMGTSADFEAAIAEGSTIVRIGTAIFGPRRNSNPVDQT